MKKSIYLSSLIIAVLHCALLAMESDQHRNFNFPQENQDGTFEVVYLEIEEPQQQLQEQKVALEQDAQHAVELLTKCFKKQSREYAQLHLLNSLNQSSHQLLNKLENRHLYVRTLSMKIKKMLHAIKKVNRRLDRMNKFAPTIT